MFSWADKILLTKYEWGLQMYIRVPNRHGEYGYQGEFDINKRGRAVLCARGNLKFATYPLIPCVLLNQIYALLSHDCFIQ